MKVCSTGEEVGTVLSLVKCYVVLMLLLLTISYLAPREGYRKYFQFFTGIWVCVLLIGMVFRLFSVGKEAIGEQGDKILREYESVEKWQGKEVDLYEFFEVDTEKEE